MAVDPSEHIALCKYIIRNMGFKGDMAEEAFSESLVALTVAAKNFDDTRGVPVSAWLAKNIRWSLTNWTNRHRYTVPMPAYLAQTRESLWDKIELQEVVQAAERILSHKERTVIMASAYGYRGYEIAEFLGCSQGWISRLYKRAVLKLKKELNETGRIQTPAP